MHCNNVYGMVNHCITVKNNSMAVKINSLDKQMALPAVNRRRTLTRNLHKLACWLHSWEIGGFLEQYSTHLMNVSRWVGMVKFDIRCCETNYLGRYFAAQWLDQFYMTVHAKFYRKIWLTVGKILPYRGASPSYKCKSCGMEGLVLGRLSCMSQAVGSNLGPKAQERKRLGKSGRTFSWPIRSQNSLITCTNHMLLGKTWNECTISFLYSTIAENRN